MVEHSRRRLFSVAAGLGALVLGGSRLQEPGERVRAIRFGRLIDCRGGVREDARVLVRGDRVESVDDGAAPMPSGAELVDLSAFTGLPGLIDVHTHMTYTYDRVKGGSPLRQEAARGEAAARLLGENARAALEAGVTTVRDLGAVGFVDVAVRDWIGRGAMVGPRMFVAGHGLVHRGVGVDARYAGAVRGVSEARRVVRAQLAAGVDWIKVFGSKGSYQDVSGDATFTAAEVAAVVDAAHGRGVRVAVHAYGPEAALIAVRAGADTIEHGVDFSDETLEEMRKRGTWWVPTIDHNRYYAENAVLYGFNEAEVDGLKDYLKRSVETARRAVRAGVRMAMGSDAVFTMFGENTRELSWFVRAGMTPLQALEAATRGGAELLGKEAELGRVGPGAFADLIAVEGDPRESIDVVIDGVKWVMKGGVVVVDRRVQAG